MSPSKTQDITLLYLPGACSVAPHIVLEELGVPYTAEACKWEGEAFQRWLKINPKQRVPVVIIDGEIITEMPAVMTALAQLDPSRKLLGKTDLETVRVYEWFNYLSATLHSQIWGAMLRPARYKIDEKLYPALSEGALKSAKEVYEAIEQKLTGLYAVGDSFTVIDPFLYVFWRFATNKDLVSKETHPNYYRLVENLVKRPSVTKVVEAEGIKMIPAQ